MTNVVCLKMVKGKQVTQYDEYIGRQYNQHGYDLPQTEWGNPFKSTYQYYKWAMADEQKEFRKRVRKKLTGKTLSCFCVGKKDPSTKNGRVCHGFVLQYICDGVMPKELAELIEKEESTLTKVEESNDEWLELEEKIVPLSVEDRIVGMFTCAFMGDSVGMRYEFGKKKEAFTAELKGGFDRFSRGTRKWKHYRAGCVSDDSEMTITLATHLVSNKGKIKAEVLLEQYMDWAHSGQSFMGHNTKYLIGTVTTRKGYSSHYKEKFGFDPCYDDEPTLESDPAEAQLSNGALMRCCPLALLKNNGHVYRDMWLTNPSSIAEEIECNYLDALRMALRGEKADKILTYLLEKESQSKEYSSVIKDIIKGKKRTLNDDKGIYTKGSAMSGLYATLWCLKWYVDKKKITEDSPQGKRPNFFDFLESIVEDFPGNDTDTNCCIMGAMMGAIIGYSKLKETKLFAANVKEIYNFSQETDTPRPLKYHPAIMHSLYPKIFSLYFRLNSTT